jgi:hypothetical protein
MTGIFRTLLSGKFFPAVVMAISPLQKLQGGQLYLTIVGPPPLRFEAAATNDPVFIAELTLPKPGDTTTTVSILPTNSTAASPPASVQNESKNLPASTSAPEFLSDAAKSAEGLVGPASNLLSIMPRMMTEYLKPIRAAGAGDDSNAYQPGETIFVPAELGFVPPMPDQNRAIYRSR